MRVVFLLATLAALAAGCAGEAPDCGGLVVSGAWVRAAPPGSNLTAGYLRADNPGDQYVEISGASSPDFARAEIHRTVQSDGQVRMEPLVSIRVAPEAAVVLTPGGRHLMLFTPRRALNPGERLQMRLACGDGEVAFSAEVRAPGASGDPAP